jgi:hypothetical protein
MSEIKRMAEDAIQYARKEIEQYGLPSMFHFDLSLQKGHWLAEMFGADVNIVNAGIAFMDLKLGEAFKRGVQNQHIHMSKEATDIFLKSYDIPDKIKDVLVNIIEAHHGGVPFSSIESEICANADCYRFVHPKGVLYYFTTLARRLNDFEAEVSQVETKLKEKMGIASLPIVREELLSYYETFVKFITLCRE